jgi:hypothetical protein
MNQVNKSLPWSASDEATLSDLIAGGAFLPEIARALGRTQEAVRCRANKLGIPVRSSGTRSNFRYGRSGETQYL